MKLKNKKTGEIRNAVDIDMYTDSVYLKVSDGEFDNETIEYHSLAELNDEWEDYKEPKEYWYYDTTKNGVEKITHLEDKEKDQEIGNYFETKEEAEKAVEKLKAWKRLRDKGFMITLQGCKGNAWLQANWGNLQGDYSDVLLLFGGEE